MEHDLDRNEAIRLINGEFGKQLLKVVDDCIAPIYWYIPQANDTHKINNGTIFFLNTGTRAFSVSAYHVYHAYHETLTTSAATKCQIADIIFHPKERIIDYCPTLDIVTFDITEDEVRKINKRFFEGHQSSWPPKPPDLEKGIFTAGYPGHERILMPGYEINWGMFHALCIANRVNENNISIQFEKEHLVEGYTTMPEGYDLAGISGAPLITLVQNSIYYWRLGGVIYEAKEDLGLVFARPADYILPDGKIRKT